MAYEIGDYYHIIHPNNRSHQFECELKGIDKVDKKYFFVDTAEEESPWMFWVDEDHLLRYVRFSKKAPFIPVHYNRLAKVD